MDADENLSFHNVDVLAGRYDAFYTRHPLEQDGLPPSGAFVVEWFYRLLRPQSRILDLGCGQGRNALALAAESHRVTAVDISRVGLEQLRDERSHLRVTCSTYGGLGTRRTDLRNLRPRRPYDAMILASVLHHMSPIEAERLLQLASESIVPNGYLGIVVHLGHPSFTDEPGFYPASDRALIDQLATMGWKVVQDYINYYRSGTSYGAVLQHKPPG